MKRILIISIILSSLLFANSIDNLKSNIVGYTNSGIAIFKTDLEWRNNLFNKNETWSDKVIQPERCKAGKTNKLNDIAMISKNILNEHPDKWLKGTYLEYVNSQCVIINKPDGTKITSEDRKGVNYTKEFLQLLENSKEKVTFWEVLWIFISDPILIAILIFGFIVQYYFLKAKADYFRTIFRKK
ncbi:hypothetical protein [Aliarcobacter butzleri]|uniref:hypothetical protein n=1 Tax=Aliarcobacter butzleri TaxID=28197 RepID=UPI00125EC40F|nr:hypothetical protein [Aliarcobacter butzleri]MCT7595896.1 hypothetical protein [Aliarcobacter butzleri]MCT7600420.1 hypothetical protein [Aliarcobacter butzleri]MDK2084297.1 hypothetical protein [Aliarcobacter butzleri]